MSRTQFSLRNLRTACVSALNNGLKYTLGEDAEAARVAQRTSDKIDTRAILLKGGSRNDYCRRRTTPVSQ